jgi:hypothetical protein
MDAVIETASPRGRRQIAFADFASSYMTGRFWGLGRVGAEMSDQYEATEAF